MITTAHSLQFHVLYTNNINTVFILIVPDIVIVILIKSNNCLQESNYENIPGGGETAKGKGGDSEIYVNMSIKQVEDIKEDEYMNVKHGVPSGPR